MPVIGREWIGRIGRRTLEFFSELGRFAKLMSRVLAELPGIVRDRNLFFQQAINLGVNSAPLVLLVGFFTGAVSGWQGQAQMQGYLPYDLIGPGTFKAVMLELGPVLTALVIAGRVSASIAAEIGSMKVTEQIDALESMAISSVRYLAVPRIMAMTIMMPILVIQAVFVALLGAWIVLSLFLSLTSKQFWGLIPAFFDVSDVVIGLLKALFFGMSSSMIGCYIGFRTEGGAEGVGRSTIIAFVWACLTILTLDFILTMILI